MSHSIVEVSQFDASIVVADDGDAANAASVSTPFQSVTNRTKYLNDHKQSAATETRVIAYAPVLQDPTTWATNTSISLDSGTRYVDAGGGVSASILSFDMDLPHGQELTTVSIYIKTGGSHGTLPVTMPALVVVRTDITAASFTMLGNQTDGSVSTAAYDVIHPITVSGLTEVVDRTKYRYAARFLSEAGTHFVAGLMPYGVTATWVRTTFGND